MRPEPMSNVVLPPFKLDRMIMPPLKLNPMIMIQKTMKNLNIYSKLFLNIPDLKGTDERVTELLNMGNRNVPDTGNSKLSSYT